jgi:hemophore-related protein
MLLRTKLAVAAAAGMTVALGPLGVLSGIASAQPDVSAVVNSTCTYPQVIAALNDENPGVANDLNTSPIANGWLQSLIAAPPDQRATMVQQVQDMPSLQPYLPVIYQVAGTCNKYPG